MSWVKENSIVWYALSDQSVPQEESDIRVFAQGTVQGISKGMARILSETGEDEVVHVDSL